MYKIIKTDGTELGVTDSVIYIRIHPVNGCFTNATEKTATGVAFKSIAYNLIGHSEIEGADTVMVTECDSGEVIGGLNAKTIKNTDHLAEVDEIAIDLFEQNLAFESICAEQDEAIIEIYEKMGATNNG